jgi:hypothetical protein
VRALGEAFVVDLDVGPTGLVACFALDIALGLAVMGLPWPQWQLSLKRAPLA